MKTAFLVRGLGEYAQAIAIAPLIRERGFTPLFLTDNAFLASLIEKDGFLLTFFARPDEANEKLKHIEANALFLCNAHTTRIYNLVRPKQIKWIFSLDSNWLFNNEKYKKLNQPKLLTYPWIDRPYLLFPRQFFLNNLKENGGYYEIDKAFREKIITPGFIPSGPHFTEQQRQEIRQKIGLSDGQKLVVSYFSKPEFHSSQIKEYIIQFERQVKNAIMHINSAVNSPIALFDLTSLWNNFKASINISPLATNDFNAIIGISDLVVMHYGYGTLPKVFANQIPVLCIIPRPDNTLHSNFFELKPCIDAKAIEYLFFDQITEDAISEKARSLLFDPAAKKEIKSNQARIFSPGEKNLLQNFYGSYTIKG
jgi:hypothetical protein